jgi:hypothetical protein
MRDMNTIPRFTSSLFAILAACTPQLRAGDFLEEMQRQNEIDSLRQDIRNTRAEIESANIDADWRELRAQQAAENARREAEMQAQWQAMMNAYQQQTPLVQPDTGTDSLVKELKNLKDEIELSRLDADFRKHQSARQERLAAMTPEERTTYLQAEQEAARRPIDLSRLSPEEQESYFNTLRYALQHGHGAAVSQERQKQLQEYDEHQKWKRDEPVCHEEIQLCKWNHQTEAGKTFMIGVFKERHLGDRKADVDLAAKQIGARFYRLWEHHKWGDLEEVKVVFYK